MNTPINVLNKTDEAVLAYNASNDVIENFKIKIDGGII